MRIWRRMKRTGMRSMPAKRVKRRKMMRMKTARTMMRRVLIAMRRVPPKSMHLRRRRRQPPLSRILQRAPNRKWMPPIPRVRTTSSSSSSSRTINKIIIISLSLSFSLNRRFACTGQEAKAWWLKGGERIEEKSLNHIQMEREKVVWEEIIGQEGEMWEANVSTKSLQEEKKVCLKRRWKEDAANSVINCREEDDEGRHRMTRVH